MDAKTKRGRESMKKWKMGATQPMCSKSHNHVVSMSWDQVLKIDVSLRHNVYLVYFNVPYPSGFITLVVLFLVIVIKVSDL